MGLHLSSFLILLLVLEYVASSSSPEIRGLRCSSTNVENYNCTWEIGSNDNRNDYNVSYEDSYSKAQVCPEPKRLHQDGNRLTCRIHKDKGGSIHCQMIEVRARGSSGRVSKDTVEFCPRKDARADPPVAIQFPSVTSTSIRVKWQKPRDVINYESKLVYQLEYRKNNTDQVWNKPPNLPEIKENTFLLTSLEEYTVYEIRMASKIELAQWGPWSSVSSATTIPGVPGIVSNMSAIESTSNSLILEWTVPSKPNGPIDYYIVRSRFDRREWFYQNTTNTRIEIPVDCNNNVTDGATLTTNVAAVNKVDSTKLRGEWAQRDVAVCLYFVTILPTALQNMDKIKAVNITLTVIIVPSAVVLILIIVKILIKKNTKLDLSGSPKHLRRQYQFKRVCPPSVEEEKFDELVTYSEHGKASVTVHKSSECSCENVYNTEDCDVYNGVACHTKLAVNPTLYMATSNQVPGQELGLTSQSTEKSPASPGDHLKRAIPSSLPDGEYVLPTDVRCLHQNDNIPNADSPSRGPSGFNDSPNADLEAYTPHNCITGHRPNDNTTTLTAASSYLPHSAFVQTVKKVEKPLSTTETSDIAYIPHTTETILYS